LASGCGKKVGSGTQSNSQQARRTGNFGGRRRRAEGERKLPAHARATVSEFLRESPDLAKATAEALSVFTSLQWSEIEQVIGLRESNHRFRWELAEAIIFCLCLHIAQPRRYADLLREMHNVRKCAEEAANKLRELREALDTAAWGRLLRSAIDCDPGSMISEQDMRRLAVTAGQIADRLAGKDRRGAPRMHVFDTLVRLLADAFARVTGRTAALTCDPFSGEYSGPFWQVVDAVLPRVAVVADQSKKGRLAQPASAAARGKAIQRILNAMDKIPAANSEL
jgi:hypothetical protein